MTSRKTASTINDLELDALYAERDGAYRERAHLLAHLAAVHPSVITLAPDVDEPGWKLLFVYVDGQQMSWHISPRDDDLFEHVERVTCDDPRAQWDGHSTAEKYERLRRLTATRDPEPGRQLGKAETELAALRQVARGYCDACGRGDAAPTVADWEQQRQRADQAEEAARRALEQRQEMAEERYVWQERGDQAEAALERVRAFLARHEHQVAVSPLDVLALLNEPTPGSAATQATKPGPAAGAVGICELPHQTIAEEDACEQQRLAGVAAGTEGTGHRYLSTGCLHGDLVLPDGRTGHQYCSNVDGIAGLKKPAQCKFCAAPCICPCHTTAKES